MCDVDRFRILTPEYLRRQEDAERAVDGEEIHCNHATTSPARSVSNASRSMGTTPKTGTVSRQHPAMDTPAEPDSKLEAGNKLPHKLGDYFPVKEMAGKPLEEIDDYYASKKSFVVIAGDKTIFRFSTTNALFLLSPFNPIRRAAIYVLVHPVFSFIILLAIIVNCIFMAMPKLGMKYPEIEVAFTAIYTVEAVIKIIARGMILSDFTYLRDAWNWLDFVVVSLAYFMFFSDALSNVSALRTLRVLRALKTVTTVPGLKTIVGALLEAVKRLRDVMVLTIFVLSIFALVGLQIYRGTLLRKCVKAFNASKEGYDLSSMTAEQEWNITYLYYNDEANWHDPQLVCKNVSADDEQPCPPGYVCIQTKTGNPNYNYTNFDNFGYAFLCAFRLMTQDYWENLYNIVIKANGMIHVIYFILVILLGSFYLMNVILAIVAMSYDEVKLQNQADEEEEEAEKKEEEEMREQILENVLHKSPSELSNLSYMELYCLSDIAQRRDDKRVEELSLHSERFEGGPRPRYFSIKKRRTCSIPGTPLARRLTAIRSPADQSPVDGSPDDSESEAPSARPPVSSSRHRQHSEGESLPPLVPFFDDSNAQSPIDIPDCLSAFALTSGRRVWNSPVLPTKTAMLDRLANNATPMEARLYRTMLNHSPLMPRRDDEMDGGVKNSPHFGQRLMPHDGSVRRKRSRGPSIQSSAVELNDVVILKALVDDTIGQHRCSLPNLAEQDKPPLKDVILRWFLATFCGWTCCPFWLKIEKIVSYIILDAFVELFITLCILANTALMALDTPFKSPQLEAFLKATNYFFTATFALEALLKLIALRPNVYFKEGWNIFDFFIVILSFVEMPLANVKGLSIFRSFRLLRVLKLAKSWNTMNLLFAIIGRTIGALGNLIFVLGIIVFIFAVVGMQLFGERYRDFRNVTLYPEYEGKGLRWHFEDFLHSFMIVFRVLCGEWIESMWDCMRVNGWKCVPFFLLTEIIASLVVLNLFLALLISSFGSESLQRREETEEPNKLEEAVDRIIRFVTWTKLHLRKCWVRFSRPLTSKFRRKRNLGATVISSPQDDEMPRGVKSELDLSLPPSLRIQIENGGMNKESDDEDDYKKSTGNLVNRTVIPLSESLKNRSPTFDEEPEVNEVEIVYCSTPDDCLPTICTTKLCPGLYERISATRFGQIWWKIRCKAYLAVEHRYFESFIIFMIILSSSTLTLEDVYLKERPVLKKTLEVMDKIFTVIFTMEMLLKWVAFGMKKYFKDAWCWLDFTIVSIALFSLLLNALGGDAAKNMQAFKAMRTLRALRPLRAVSRWEGMRIVVNALIQSVPSIFNVLLVILVFWLIFSIMGVQLFGGRFFKCKDANKTTIQDDFYWHRDNCTYHSELYGNVTWENSKINFDNIFNGYLALFQVATYKGWIEIMADATDITDIHHQPQRENKVILYLYFVMFIIIGSFFTLNLFIGVIIDNFNVQKKKAGGSIELFMTDEQKKYYKAMKKMDSTTLQKPIPKPKFKIGKIFYYIVHHQTFDIVIMVFIMLNTFVMCIEYHDQSQLFNNVLKYVNTVFVAIFTGECVCKLIALRLHYFKFPWNVFDFVIVIFSIVCMCMEDIMKAINFSPTLIRIVRVFRIGRVLRLVKSARGIRTLLFSLFVSLPALINIALLLIMIMFIYAMVGMSFFASVPYYSGIDYMFNFQTFSKSMMVLFQMCTSAGWSGVLEGLTNNPECEKEENKNKCPNYALAVSYLCSYLMISFLVIVNMYIAVILENFSQATEDVQQGLTQDDFDIFYEKWENYDLKARGYITLEQVYDFLDEVDPPLGLLKPNRVKLAVLEVPIRENDVIYSVDLLDKITRSFLGTPAEDEDVSKVSGPKEKAKEKRPVISNTLLRQREHVAARIITHFIRNCAKSNRARNGPRLNSVYPNSPRRENLVEVTSESRAVV